MDIHIKKEKPLLTNAQSYQKAEALASTLVLADKLSFSSLKILLHKMSYVCLHLACSKTDSDDTAPPDSLPL